MSTRNPNCRTCRAPMEEGWIADRGHGNQVEQEKWTAGEPEMQRWLIFSMGPKVKGKQQYAITSWRCPQCGLLESYAI